MTYRPRLFVGIELDDAARAACAQVAQRLERAGLAARFEPAEKLHITLAFLGNVDAEIVGAVQDALATAASEIAPFSLTLDRVGAFPHERRPRIVFVGCREQGEAFRRAANSVRDALKAVGFDFEKAPVAHVTIARVKGGEAHLPSVQVAPIKVNVRAVALFESIPDGRTTRYEVLSRAKLM